MVRGRAERSARDAACMFLAAQAARFPDLAIEGPETEGLDGRDAALAHAICDAAVRRWLTLSHLLELALQRPLSAIETAVRGVLLSGAAQLILLDRIPAHAAINESVEWAKREVRPGAGGMVNAVLRKVAAMRAAAPPETGRRPWDDARDRLPLADGGCLQLSSPLLPSDLWERLAVATSHPVALLARWRAQLGDDAARRIAMHDLCEPPVVINARYSKTPAHAGDAVTPHDEAGFTVLSGGRDAIVTLLRARDDVWVQDPSSAGAVAAAAERAAGVRRVVDLCAGQGTKTRQLAAAFPEAEVVATDIDPARFRVLGETFAGHGRVRVVDPAEGIEACRGRAGLVLADVPCSNTGVLARRAEARYRAGPRALARLAAVQNEILVRAVSLLGPEGYLLYSTCSIDREENEDRLAKSASVRGLQPVAQSLRLPGGLPGDPPALYRDGAFWALLARRVG